MNQRLMTCVVLVLVAANGVHAGLGPHENLLARRAAELDAYRQLAERVMGLHLSSTTTVRDFVTESDDIKTGVRAFIRGARSTAVRNLEDGTCEVDMEMTLRSVITCLKTLHAAHIRGGSFKSVDFEEIRKFEKLETIQVTGSGAPRSVGCEPALDDLFSEERPATVPVSGVWKSIPPQQRLMARRAALVDGYRRLAEQVYGLRLDSTTTVRDFVTENDVIRTQVEALVRGAREIETRFTDDGIVEVDVAVTVQQVVTELTRLQSEHRDLFGSSRIDFESVRRQIDRKVITATGMGAAVKPAPRPEEAEGDSVELIIIERGTTDE